MVDVTAFGVQSPGDLVPISGADPRRGPWSHSAFVPRPLGDASPELRGPTYLIVANARAALAALDSTASRLPNPRLLRRPSLQAEAQSTSALEGTYAPLAEVYAADEDRPPNPDVREVLNYVAMADTAFGWVEEGRSLTVGGLGQLQGILVQGTRHEGTSAGGVREEQVVIGHRPGGDPLDFPVHAARFVPSPPGVDLQARLQDLLAWMGRSHSGRIDPVVAAAMAHYQFETLHPFQDGNGRIGRLLVVLHLLIQGTLSEPTLTVSPWFETRRSHYYDRLLAVSTDADWDSYVRFFAAGLESSATTTRQQMIALVDVQQTLKEQVRRSSLRADTAQALVDYAVGHPSFSVRAVERDLAVSYGRANALVSQLIALGILAPLPSADRSRRRFHAPDVLQVLVGGRSHRR